MANPDYDELFKSLDTVTDNLIKASDKLVDTSIPKLTELLNMFSAWLVSKL